MGSGTIAPKLAPMPILHKPAKVCGDLPSGARKFNYFRATVDWAQSKFEIAAHCSHEAVSQKDSRNPSPDLGLAAVYIIGPDGDRCSKIGLSLEPNKRLHDIQVANFDDVHLHYTLWVWDDNAKTIENNALFLAQQAGHDIRGEWVGCNAHTAFQFVLDAAESAGVHCSSIRASHWSVSSRKLAAETNQRVVSETIKRFRKSLTV